MIDILKKAPLFRGISETVLEKLIDLGSVKRFKPGESTAAVSVLSGLPYPASSEVVQEGKAIRWNDHKVFWTWTSL